MDNLFLKFMMEADEPPPDIEISDPPDVGNDADTGPPDIDMPMDIPDDMGAETMDPDDPYAGEEEQLNDGVPEEELVVDEKIETILKKTLYTEFLNLISTLSDIEKNFLDNNDLIFSKCPDASSLLEDLTSLKTNTVEYCSLYFMERSYAASRLLYNKVKISLQLIVDKFEKLMKKAVKE